jgi:hypothetical protein
MVWYRSLFSDLLEGPAVVQQPIAHREEVRSDERTDGKQVGWGRR